MNSRSSVSQHSLRQPAFHTQPTCMYITTVAHADVLEAKASSPACSSSLEKQLGDSLQAGAGNVHICLYGAFHN